MDMRNQQPTVAADRAVGQRRAARISQSKLGTVAMSDADVNEVVLAMSKLTPRKRRAIAFALRAIVEAVR